jgi:trehalose 6-phosphate phosphatase
MAAENATGGKVKQMNTAMPENGMVAISAKKFRAGIFDLDGVVTRTAKVHAAAWKKLFDEYLHQRSVKYDEEFVPFDIDSDYSLYIDGKPRAEGAKSFLKSRGINLPYGRPDDPPDRETVCGLGKKKDIYFKRLLKERGVQVYESSIRLIRKLRARNMRTAIVSSSKNCREVLEAAAITDLFDARVDGKDSAKLGFTGKPEPDAFLEASRQIGVAPERAVVIEDALAGVEAGRRGGFGLVIGVDRTGKPEALLKSGAQAVVSDLSQVEITNETSPAAADSVPSALQHFEEIRARIHNRTPVVFLDYDGTLTPIVDRPEDAILPARMRRALRLLAKSCTVAIISGRDLRDVKKRVGVKGIIYAGSHGFEIAGPPGSSMQYEIGVEHLPVLNKVEEELHRELDTISGVLIERKKFSVAIHYRLAELGSIKSIGDVTALVVGAHPELRQFRGKMVIDVQPAIDWNKGKAVHRLLEQVSCSGTDLLPIYVGDDTTDEDAFGAIRQSGIGILVSGESRPTAARYALKNPDEVQQFLEILALSALSEVTW